MPRVDLLISAAEAGQRLDRTLLNRLPELSRKELQQLFSEAQVERNGRVAVKGEAVRSGDRVTLQLPANLGAATDPELALDVAFENACVVIVDKPAKVPSAPLRPGEKGCIANALLARYPEMKAIGYNALEPGLIHRLDNDTSGLLVAARSEPAFLQLSRDLKAGKLRKKYLALARPGALDDAGELRHYIGPTPGDSRRVRCSETPLAKTKRAKTQYRVLERTEHAWLLELSVTAAYRHQIRCQLAHAGCPLLGDDLYRGPQHAALQRHALHASFVRWPGSGDLEGFEVRSALPRDMAAVLA